jgi:hypothetical protein
MHTTKQGMANGDMIALPKKRRMSFHMNPPNLP